MATSWTGSPQNSSPQSISELVSHSPTRTENLKEEEAALVIFNKNFSAFKQNQRYRIVTLYCRAVNVSLSLHIRNI